MRISDWSSDVCSSDLKPVPPRLHAAMTRPQPWRKLPTMPRKSASPEATETSPVADFEASLDALEQLVEKMERSEEHTSELQSLMRISYAVFCLKKKTKTDKKLTNTKTEVQRHTNNK